MIGVITIFVLPQEIEDLTLTLYNLKKNSVWLDGSVTYKVDITLSLSDTLTDWNNTKLPKEWFIDRSQELIDNYLDWAEVNINYDNDILGCVSQRRDSWKRHKDADFFIWLDTDLYFSDITLNYIEQGFKMTSGDRIITPEFVRQWDTTWDIITNELFLNKPVNYYKHNNLFKDVNQISVNGIEKLPVLKFAGGWFTLLSKSVLDKCGIPNSFGHYGLEDTFIMYTANDFAEQYKIKGLLCGELHKGRTNKSIKSLVANIDRKEEFRKIAELNFYNEIQKKKHGRDNN
jgi:hypothetical protein